MYPPVKDKFVPSSPTRHTFRRIVPRHTKAYLWLSFLIVTFGYLLLLDNGIQLFNLWPRFTPSYTPNSDYSSPAHNEVLLPPTQQHLTSLPIPPSPPPPLSEQPTDPTKLVFGNGSTSFTPDDVIILFKTGATTLWRRVPIHLSTTLSDKTLTPNILFYSDQEDQIAGHPIIDVLANVSDTLKSSPDFELYRTLKTVPSQNLYLESATIDGDHYLPGGWRLDKYKFLPLMAHAAAASPGKKWYIYMEDDNYFFWHSLYTWLSTFDSSKPLFLGGPAARLGEDFAHGGSGFIISGAALAKTFGANPNLAREWEPYAAQRCCCGDQVLSHVLSVNGVPRDRRYDHTGWAGLQALAHWRMAFGHWNWCSPLFNVHKTHQADISRLHILEQAFQTTHSPSKIMTWGGLYNLTLSRQITRARRTEWDNDASEKWFASKEADQALSQAEREKQPWFSADACEAACEAWGMCLSWKYADDACGLSSTVVDGRPVKEGIELTSGYLLGRIEGLQGKVCPGLGFGS